jgi:hypothetical protein
MKMDVMAYDKQWMVDTLRRLGYTEASDAAEQELPDDPSNEQVRQFGDKHGIDVDELASRMGGSP